jgi:hypothetical protein
MQTPITFNYEAFILAYPEFSNPITFPSNQLQGYWDAAIQFMNPSSNPMMTTGQLTLALNLYTAHLAELLGVIMASGDTPAVTLNATVDKVQVGNQPVELPNQWQYWMQSTGYGQILLALLQVLSVGGWLVGGWNERGAIRQAYGDFPAGNLPGPYLGIIPQ